MLTCRRTNNLRVIGYFVSDYADYKDTIRHTSNYIFMLFDEPIS